MIRLRAVLIPAVVVALVTITGCGSDSSDDSSSSTTGTSGSGAPLERTRWILNDSIDVPTEGVSVTAQFTDGRVAGNSGCNTYTAPFETKGTKLTIGPDIVTTRMACAPGPTAVEASYLDRLKVVTAFAIDGETLTLQDSGGAALLVYNAGGGAEALIGKWKATSLYTGNAIQSVIDGSTLTANFDADEVSGSSGCNDYGGSYEATADTIKLGPFRSTLKACADPELQTQEQQFTAALELATTYRVTDQQLELFRADGGIAATFEKAKPAG